MTDAITNGFTNGVIIPGPGSVAYGDVFDEMVALSQELGFRVRILLKRSS